MLKYIAAYKTMIRTFLLLFALFPFISTPSHAARASIAHSTDNSYGWATGASQAEANREAIKLCGTVTKTKDCKLSLQKAIVVAEGGGGVAYGWSEKSVSEARKGALKRCGSPDCKVSLEVVTPGFFSLARTKDGNQQMHYHLAYGSSNGDLSREDAKRQCEKTAGRECEIAFASAIPGEIRSTKRAAEPVSSKSCRPATATVRCTSQCVNGNCVISYENGCKMRVQVPPEFDPITRQMRFPSPMC